MLGRKEGAEWLSDFACEQFGGQNTGEVVRGIPVIRKGLSAGQDGKLQRKCEKGSRGGCSARELEAE